MTPKELIERDYYPLQGAVDPLVDLIRVNPRILRDVIELALVMGIHAEQRREAWARETGGPIFGRLRDDLEKGW